MIKDLETGINAAGRSLLLRLERKSTKRGKPYLDLELGDNTGTVNAKSWDWAPQLDQCGLVAGEPVLWRGLVETFNDALQVSIKKLEASDNTSKDGLVPESTHSEKELADALNLHVGALDSPYQEICRATLEFVPQMVRWPAAKAMHHAYLRGLLEHTVDMMNVAEMIAPFYDLNIHLLKTGVLFHDLGKCEELGELPGSDYTERGQLLGHIAISLGLLWQAVDLTSEGVPTHQPLIDEIAHLILSHHGRKEWGSPIEPATKEAVALHLIDMLDSKLNGFPEGNGEFVYAPMFRRYVRAYQK